VLKFHRLFGITRLDSRLERLKSRKLLARKFSLISLRARLQSAVESFKCVS
jgi:hypothetical protein